MEIGVEVPCDGGSSGRRWPSFDEEPVGLGRSYAAEVEGDEHMAACTSHDVVDTLAAGLDGVVAVEE